MRTASSGARAATCSLPRCGRSKKFFVKARDRAAASSSRAGNPVEAIRPGDRVLLVVENDPNFAHILLQMARERGFRGLVATRGDQALALAKQFKPDAVTLDLRLPDTDGLVVLERLKQDLSTRHIPVHIISVADDARLKKQEEFILRVPLAGKMFEFPFRLPPSEGELILRRRE